MAAWASALIPAIANLAGSAMGTIGAGNLNIANRDFAGAQATAQRNFEQQQQLQAEQYNTQMSNTAFQRRVADLKAAGINPMFGIQAGPASAPSMSAPSGAMAATPMTSNPMANLQTGVSTGVSSAIDAMGTQANAANQQSQADLNRAKLPYAAKTASNTADQIAASTADLKKDAQLKGVQWDYTSQDAQRLMQQNWFNREMYPLSLRAQELDNQGKLYGLAPLKTQAWYWNSPLAAPIYAGQQGFQAGGYPGAATAAAGATALKASGWSPFNSAQRVYHERMPTEQELTDNSTGQ